MRKQTWISVFLLVAFCLTFVKVQSMVVQERKGRRIEEKILMLSNRPEVTKILALGHDATVADLLWIRAIQYFGGNFSSLKDPDKKQGMVNLFRNMTALDPNFVAAYQFGGFVMNESIQDANLAVSFLLEGAEINPLAWRLRFDAGFIAFYQIKDYDTAKRLFIQSAYGNNLALNATIQTTGLLEGFNAQAIADDDTQGEVKFNAPEGSIVLDLGSGQSIGRINVIKNTAAKESFNMAYAGDADSAANASFQELSNSMQPGISLLTTPVSARYIRMDSFQTEAEDGFFEITEVQLHGQHNPEVPSYVERMAIEMDRAAGRFRVAWDQYLRYYMEHKKSGDEISAGLTATKLDTIYMTKVEEILDETIRLYLEKEGKLPSSSMKELVEENYLQQVLQTKVQEDPQFQTDVLPVLLGANQNVYNMLMTWDGSSPIIMVPVTGEENKMDWIITTRASLVDTQTATLDALQKLVDQYKEEKGNLPAKLEDLKADGRMFNAPDSIFIDPLGGEFYINPQTGKVEARNSKY